MTSPLGAPFHVDVVRFGGSQATQRHAFGTPGNGVAPQAPPPAARPAPLGVSAPPTRIYLGDRPLGQGQPTTPRIPPEALPELEAAIGHAVETLRYELETVKAEAQMVTPEAVRSNPDAWKSIDVVGQYLTPQEIRSVLILDAQDISAQAQRLLSKGSVAPYVPPSLRSVLNTVVADAEGLIRFLRQFDLAPLAGGNAKLANEHAATHTSAAAGVIDAIEREVVTYEAASVPVIEPAESSLGGPGALLALGALVAVTVILMETL